MYYNNMNCTYVSDCKKNYYPKKFDVNFINTFLIQFYNHMEKNYCIIVYFETLNFLQGALPFVRFI